MLKVYAEPGKNYGGRKTVPGDGNRNSKKNQNFMGPTLPKRAGQKVQSANKQKAGKTGGNPRV